MVKVLLSSQAEDDIKKGIDFYENMDINLGSYFFNSIMSDIESLKIYKGIHIKINEYYRMLSKKFPFAIYYKIEDENIKVYAILDCRQNPKKIKKRLKSE